MRARRLLVAAAASLCGAALAGARLAPAAVLPVSPHPSITDPAVRASTEQYIAETLRVIGSPEFEASLTGIDRHVGPIRLSPSGATLPSAEVAAVYLGRVPGHRAVPSTVLWVKGDGAVAVHDRGRLTIRLGAEKRRQWESGDVVRRSCAVNTLAHELAHTVPQGPGAFRYLFADGSRWWATTTGRALASYTIGAVAQCTYLERAARLTGGSLAACVDHWGKNQFYSGDCQGSFS